MSSPESESTIPSSPVLAEHTIFSSEPARCSSPPSSPPGFQWHTDKDKRLQSPSAPRQAPATAFSLLGKRKALTDLDHNLQPTKRRAASAQQASRQKKRANERPMTQTQLSLGQPVQKSCQACGMEFVLSSEEDRVLHQQHHTNVTQGYHIGKTFRWKDWVCFKSERPGDMILAIDRSRPMPQRRRAMEVLKVVERELGAVEIGGDELWGTIPDKSDLKGRFTNYVYVREGRCIAYLLMERITKAHPVIAPKSRSKEGSVTENPTDAASTSALKALKARRQAISQAFTSSQPIQLSNKHIPAVIGVSRVWTLPTYRSHDIATSLLDTATAHLLGRDGSCDEPGRGCISCIAPNRAEYRVLTADEKIKRVAFSQPTQAGARLARRWFGKLYGWMVYAN